MKIITLGDNLIVGKKYRLVSLGNTDLKWSATTSRHGDAWNTMMGGDGSKHYGAEYSATHEGLELYKEAMGSDLDELQIKN